MTSQVESTISMAIHDDPKSTGELIVTCTVKDSEKSGVGHSRAYVGTVSAHSEELEVQWKQEVPPATLSACLAILKKRLAARREWLGRVEDLVSTVEQVAKDLDWVTRRSQKRIEDWEIGDHLVPILVMQQDAVRLLLEPISRKTPGSEGLIDLYLMPGLDDIASILFYDSAWHLHYFWEGEGETKGLLATQAKPVDKNSLKQVFEEMVRASAS